MNKIMVTEAPRPRSESVQIAAWVYAAILVVMALGQLYAFEDFIPLIAEYKLPGGDVMAVIVASLIVATEVFALPFLLRMPVSPLMRWVSLACSVTAASIWALLSLWAYNSAYAITSGGLLGTKVAVPVGIVSVGISIGLFTLALYCAWGLWPVRTRKK